jgi:hypothetical protein
LLPALVAGSIIIVGWLVAERFARMREKRSDLRLAVASLSSAINEVVSAAVDFYQMAGDEPLSMSLAATIRAKVASLSVQLSLLKAAGLNIDADELLKQLRKTVTGGQFDSITRQPLTPTSPAFSQIGGAAQALDREVHIAMLTMLLSTFGAPTSPGGKLCQWWRAFTSRV